MHTHVSRLTETSANQWKTMRHHQTVMNPEVMSTNRRHKRIQAIEYLEPHSYFLVALLLVALVQEYADSAVLTRLLGAHVNLQIAVVPGVRPSAHTLLLAIRVRVTLSTVATSSVRARLLLVEADLGPVKSTCVTKHILNYR